MKTQGDSKYRAYIGGVTDDLKDTLQRGLEFINWDKYIGQSSSVFIKPNFTLPYYKEGITTSPELLRCLLEIVKSKAARVVLGESDGGNHSFTADAAFKNHDMHEICKQTGVELVNLSTLPRETVESEVLGRKVRVELPRMLLKEIDCLISVPVLKVHAMTTVSLGLKNLWGCIPDTMRCLHHQNLPYMLALIAGLVKAQIVVIDGTYALDGHGPMYGESVKTNLLLIADNPLVADGLGARTMGFSPQKVKHLAVAEKAGIGSLRLEDAEINTDWRQYRRQFKVGRTIVDWLSALMFHNDFLARLVMASPLTPAIYKVASLLKSPDEKELSRQLNKGRKYY